MKQKNIFYKLLLILIILIPILMYKGINFNIVIEILLGIFGGFSAALIFEEFNHHDII